jgi:hypothetical protein
LEAILSYFWIVRSIPPYDVPVFFLRFLFGDLLFAICSFVYIVVFWSLLVHFCGLRSSLVETLFRVLRGRHGAPKSAIVSLYLRTIVGSMHCLGSGCNFVQG